MRVLGINDGHNASMCLLEDGEVTFAWQEERVTRRKNQMGSPLGAVAHALEARGLTPDRIDVVALGGERVAVTSGDLAAIRASVKEDGAPGRALRRLVKQTPLARAFYGVQRRRRLDGLAAMGFDRKRVQLFEHHACHAASAFFGAREAAEATLVLTCDAAGDGLCATASVGRGTTLERRASVPQADSIAQIYTMITVLLGMAPNEHEYKVMGMAPYAGGGGPGRVAEKLGAMFDLADPKALVWKRRAGVPDAFRSYGYLRELLEFERFDHVCAGVQLFLETHLTDWVKKCLARTGLDRLALAGGVFMNIKANLLLCDLPEVASLFVFPSCGDETNAFGAAYLAHARATGSRPAPLRSFYLGPEFTAASARAAAESYRFKSAVRIEEPADPEAAVAALLAEGEVVARFQGREEFGARALGNRSLLADPRRPQVIKLINEMIKCRDFWMPFASSVLFERRRDYLDNPKDIPAPHMILAFRPGPRGRELPAGSHPYDGTIRPQVVSEGDNPGYHRLLRLFEEHTGVGGLLNTSFNLHGEPLVSSPVDALRVFDVSGLRRLSLGPLLISKAE